MIEEINSLKNDKIKLITSLKNKKYRDEYKCFIVEGIKLVEEALSSEWSVEEIVFCNHCYDNNDKIQNIIEHYDGKVNKITSVPHYVFNKISDTDSPQGILAVVKKKDFSVEEVIGDNNSLIVILDGLQNPGNVGTIIRTADAAGCSGILMTQECADIFSPKTVRAAMGSIFHFPIITDISREEVLSFAKKYKINLFVTSLHAPSMFTYDFTGASAIIFGNEGKGVSDIFLNSDAEKFSIPMPGKAESLNVSSAAAIILYEVVRQRFS